MSNKGGGVRLCADSKGIPLRMAFMHFCRSRIGHSCGVSEEVAQIVVNKEAGVSRVTDLKGKAAGLGLPESGIRFSSELLLEYFGVGESDRVIFGPVLWILPRDAGVSWTVRWRGSLPGERFPFPGFTTRFGAAEYNCCPSTLRRCGACASAIPSCAR